MIEAFQFLIFFNIRNFIRVQLNNIVVKTLSHHLTFIEFLITPFKRTLSFLMQETTHPSLYDITQLSLKFEFMWLQQTKHGAFIILHYAFLCVYIGYMFFFFFQSDCEK